MDEGEGLTAAQTGSEKHYYFKQKTRGKSCTLIYSQHCKLDEVGKKNGFRAGKKKK